MPGENVGAWVSGINPPNATWQPYEDYIHRIHNFFMSEESSNGSHYRNVVSPDFNKVGVGVAVRMQPRPDPDPKSPGTQQVAFLWLTVDFMRS
jgi:hypothetical protein